MADRVEKPGQKLEVDTFIEEVRLTPASLRDLRSGYGEGAAPIRSMKIHHPDTDSPTLHLREGSEGVVGETMGQDLNENVVLHRDDAGTLYEIEVYGDASRVFDLTRLEVEGLPVNVSPWSGKKQSRSGTSPPGSNPPPRAKDLLE